MWLLLLLGVRRGIWAHTWLWSLFTLPLSITALSAKVPWTTRRSNQSILKEINPEYSLEGLILKLKLQYFGHVMWRVNSLEKTLVLGKIEARRRGRQRMASWMASPIQWTRTWANTGRWWGAESSGMLQSVGSQRVGHNLVTKQQQRAMYCVAMR